MSFNTHLRSEADLSKPENVSLLLSFIRCHGDNVCALRPRVCFLSLYPNANQIQIIESQCFRFLCVFAFTSL